MEIQKKTQNIESDRIIGRREERRSSQKRGLEAQLKILSENTRAFGGMESREALFA